MIGSFILMLALNSPTQDELLAKLVSLIPNLDPIVASEWVREAGPHATKGVHYLLDVSLDLRKAGQVSSSSGFIRRATLVVEAMDRMSQRRALRARLERIASMSALEADLESIVRRGFELALSDELPPRAPFFAWIRRALGVDPDHPGAHAALAVWHARQTLESPTADRDNLARAEAALSRLDRESQDYEAQWARSLVYHAQAHVGHSAPELVEQALGAYDGLISTESPHSSYACFQRALLLRELAPDEADRALVKATELREDWFKPHLVRGLWCKADGRLEDASQELGRATELDDNVHILAEYARTLGTLSDERAEGAWRSLLQRVRGIPTGEGTALRNEAREALRRVSANEDN